MEKDMAVNLRGVFMLLQSHLATAQS